MSTRRTKSTDGECLNETFGFVATSNARHKVGWIYRLASRVHKYAEKFRSAKRAVNRLQLLGVIGLDGKSSVCFFTLS